MKAADWLKLNFYDSTERNLLMQELRKIPYIGKRTDDTIDGDNMIPYEVVWPVFERFRSHHDLAITIMSANNRHRNEPPYELVLIAIGKWCRLGKDGKRRELYRSLGSTWCTSTYECIAKATLVFYMFIKKFEKQLE